MQGMRLKTLVVCLAATLPIITHAYTPSVTAQGMGGTYASGWADGLIPLYMNNQQLVYSDLQFEGNSTNAGILSAGGGYRQQINSDGIAGAYLFYDRERSASESYYNVISPGVEYLTSSWQYRFNYYLPFGNKTNLVSQGWADEFGNTQFVEFSGHSEMDRMQYNYESMSYGADFTVGYRFQTDKRWQVNLSPYAFNETDSNAMLGANAQLNFYSNDHTTVFIGDGYDNTNHNRVFVGVSLTFGGHNNDETVSNLMQSPVYRNLDVNTTSGGVPASHYTDYSSAPTLEADNIYFVNNASDGYSSGDEDGTYENPYSNIDSVSDISDDTAQIRVEDTGETYTSTDQISLAGEQTITGYTNDYTTVATGADRPTIQSEGFELNGQNSITGLQLLGYGSSNSIGITVNNSAIIEDVLVGSSVNSQSYQIGVDLTNGALATISNATITAYSDANDANVYGVKAEGNNALTVDSSTINAIATGGDGNSDGTGALSFALAEYNGSVGIIDNTTMNSNSSGNLGIAYGLYLSGAGDVTVTDSVMTSTANNGKARGAYVAGSEGDTVISGSTMTANASTDAKAVFNQLSDSDSMLTITDSTMNATASASAGTANGLTNSNNAGDVVVTDSTINATSTGSTSTAYGIYSNGNAGSLTVSASELNVLSENAAGTALPAAFGVVVRESNPGAVDLTDLTVTVVESGGSGAIGVANQVAGASDITLSDSTINVTAATPVGVGVGITQSNNTIITGS